MRNRKFFQLISIFLLLALALTACANGAANNAAPTETLPPLGEPGDDVVPETGEDVDEGAVQAGEDVAQDIIDSPVLGLVSDVLGTKLVNQQGDELGEIIDLAYDEHNGIVVYAILSPRGDPDAPLSGQLAFPWRLLSHPGDLEEEVSENALPRSVPDPLVFNGDEQLLRDAPTLQTDQLAEADFSLWSEQLYYYWREVDDGFHIVGVSDATVLARISGLERIKVIRGESGEVLPARDVAMDLGTGNMLYIILEAANLLPGEEGLLMIPYEYLRYGSTEDGQIGYIFTEGEDGVRAFPRLNESQLPPTN